VPIVQLDFSGTTLNTSDAWSSEGLSSKRGDKEVAVFLGAGNFREYRATHIESSQKQISTAIETTKRIPNKISQDITDTVFSQHIYTTSTSTDTHPPTSNMKHRSSTTLQTPAPFRNAFLTFDLEHEQVLLKLQFS
jgi:hypothetical protein